MKTTLPFNPEGAKYACYRCSSDAEPGALAESASRISKKGSFVQLFDNRDDVRKGLLAAYLGSLMRMREGRMKSNSMDKEMLLLISGKHNISSAIDEFGARNSRDFILFASDQKTAKSFIGSERLTVRGPCKLRLETKAGQK